MTTRDWQAAVAGGPPWEGKQIIIPTVFLYIALYVFTPIECNIEPYVFTPIECTKMTGN